MRARLCIPVVAALLAVAWTAPLWAQDANPGPNRREGEGPFDKLIIRGATLIDGAGGPPRGPVDIVIEKNRITQVADVGYPGLPIDQSKRPKGPAREIQAEGMYVTPGFIDLHVHTCGKPKAPDAEYCYKLWLAHGVTTVRGVPLGGFEWSASETRRASANEITAPRLINCQRIGTGKAWGGKQILTPDDGRNWVRWAKEQGVDCLKLGAHEPTIMAAVLDESKKLGMGSTAHLQQTGVGNMNAADAVKLGLGAVTHFSPQRA